MPPLYTIQVRHAYGWNPSAYAPYSGVGLPWREATRRYQEAQRDTQPTPHPLSYRVVQVSP